MTQPAYDPSSIQFLEGLEPVRKRPGMYIGGTDVVGLHHLIWEIVDNSVDEAMNGHATAITVTRGSDGSITVEDDGRGIPVGIHPKHNISAVEIVFTKLHAGGKFDSGAYAASGGLHGVGASVVNALSTTLDVWVRREGGLFHQQFARGIVQHPLRRIGDDEGHGTKVRFVPDDLIFETVVFESDRIATALELKTYLNPGLKIRFVDEVAGTDTVYHHAGGVVDYIKTFTEGDCLLDVPLSVDKDNAPHRIRAAFWWTDSPNESVKSFANGIPTRDGGTHENGFKEAIVRCVRKFAETHELLPKGLTLSPDDIREGLVGAVAVILPNPQFQGQTKDRLNNTEIKSIVLEAIVQSFDAWLFAHRTKGETIVQRAIQAARAREASRKAQIDVRRKSPVTSRLALPGKLADCSSSDASITELFLVEGDSAGGSAKQGRDRKTQAVLPLRGKVLNAHNATLTKIQQNKELQDIATALGCGMDATFRADKLRYGKLILLMDADSDGHHISTLMLTFLWRCMPDLIKGGFVYLAQPPLYRVVVGKESYWATDDAHRDRLLKTLNGRKVEITRFKGLGEMPPSTLFETTLCPTRRKLIRITADDAEAAAQTLEMLLGDDPSQRYQQILEHADRVSDLDV